ncbi:recombination regulator RecX [Yersinia aleksiciae]|uniref:Regulatory protein RecX n=1 Tax=Yersinia aleksiciae TaxID=263819 RepID=A0A0T9TS09_YERAE|nr:recombination regulator RecX [Yersinia aleksiciae]AKP34451.1 recombinase RecX [Yersinia aleksiciae]MDA5497861.1 recombination regulator RecX [Yersinia aleksiciae]NIL00962.1 recombination regulator RecX [Yersinia aleksiciae]WQC69984.1 recombination regulator RecX [Yersinia aleksiciae]CFQ56982.1 recombination regulator RecX [Yersinia aleksiciae]
MNDLLSRAMRLLSQRDHSESELRRKLAAQPFSAKGNWGRRANSEGEKLTDDIDPKVIDQVIAYCYQHDWLDDSRFATSYINSRSRKGYGAQRIRSELMQKGVDKERIQAAFEISEIDWCMLAKEVAQRKFSETLPVEWKEKAKVQRYLLYRGFFQEEIQSIYNDFVE